MSFDSELEASTRLKVNLVFKITAPSPVGVTYFSKYQVQSGLVVPTANTGMVESFSVPGTQIDLLTAKQDVGSATVNITDVGNVFSNFMGQPLSALIGLRADLYIGLITQAGMPFSEYVADKQNYVIKTINKRGNVYSIGLKSQQDRMQNGIYGFRGNLTAFHSDVTTSMTIETGGDTFKAATGLSPQRAKIGKELVQYTSKFYSAPVTTITGVSRGDESSDAVTHKAGEECWFVEKVEENPIDILLKLMTSTGFGTNGPYDTLFDGCSVPYTDIDTASFAMIKSTYYPSDIFTLFFYNIDNALKYIEVELLQANNLRLTEVDGKIGLAILDQSIPGDTLPIVNQDVILAAPGPTWQLTEQRLFNSFVMQYFYNEGTGTYAKTKQFDDASSQAIHGIRTTTDFKFKGITSDGNAQERGNRILDRFSSPQSEIGVTQFLKTYKTPPGEKVTFTHPDLPAPGGGLGLNHELELLRKAINYATGQVQATYVFTSYVNLRRGLIAPSSAVATMIAANKITVPASHGVRYKVGYVLRLFSSATDLQVDPVNNIVSDVTGDTITFQNNFVGLTAVNQYLKFADYDDSSDVQRAKYMYIVGSSGLFADGTGGYKIY